MSDLIGKRVQFRVLERRRSLGRAKDHCEVYFGNVVEARGDIVIIEGEKGAKYNRQINEIAVLEAGR
jgi:hypothetical protein